MHETISLIPFGGDQHQSLPTGTYGTQADLESQYTEQAIDELYLTTSGDLFTTSGTTVYIQVQAENKYHLLLSIFPGIREMNEEESNEYQEFLESYFE